MTSTLAWKFTQEDCRVRFWDGEKNQWADPHRLPGPNRTTLQLSWKRPAARQRVPKLQNRELRAARALLAGLDTEPVLEAQPGDNLQRQSGFFSVNL